MDKTYLDDVVEIPVKALQKIGTDKTVVQLLTDNPNIDMESDEAYKVFDNFLYDYLYVDGTTTESAAYICVEAETSKPRTPTMRSFNLYVTIICHKQFMAIDSSKFKGMIGNRRDNLLRYVDKLLNGSDAFGVGKLQLEGIQTVSSPAGFSAREITYSIPNFRPTRVEGLDGRALNTVKPKPATPNKNEMTNEI